MPTVVVIADARRCTINAHCTYRPGPYDGDSAAQGCAVWLSSSLFDPRIVRRNSDRLRVGSPRTTVDQIPAYGLAPLFHRYYSCCRGLRRPVHARRHWHSSGSSVLLGLGLDSRSRQHRLRVMLRPPGRALRLATLVLVRSPRGGRCRDERRILGLVQRDLRQRLPSAPQPATAAAPVSAAAGTAGGTALSRTRVRRAPLLLQCPPQRRGSSGPLAEGAPRCGQTRRSSCAQTRPRRRPADVARLRSQSRRRCGHVSASARTVNSISAHPTVQRRGTLRLPLRLRRASVAFRLRLGRTFHVLAAEHEP